MLSCQVILGLDEPVGVARPDAAAEAEAGPNTCAHASPPPQPASNDDPSPAAQKDYWFATEQLIVPYRNRVLPGVDLDQSCTCQPGVIDNGPSCKTPMVANSTHCDSDGGVDDALGDALSGNLVSGFDLNKAANAQFREGRRGLLVYLSDYNGKANDTEVGVAFVPSGGLYSNLGCDGNPRDAGLLENQPQGAPGPRYAPVWDGCDRWSPYKDRVLGSGFDAGVRYVVATKAYVTNFTLVVKNISEVTLELFGGSLSVTNPIAVGQIRSDSDGPNRLLRIEGFISGRLPFANFLQAVGSVTIKDEQNNDQPLCKNTGLWDLARPDFCKARDSMVSPASDKKGEICDAVTATIGFVARQSSISDKLGDYDNLTTATPCSDSQIDCGYGTGK